MNSDEVARVELAEAADSASIAESLAAIGNGPQASAWPLGGGQLVITGAGFYVNRAIGVGLTAPMTEDDFVFLEDRCLAAVVPAEIEVCPWVDRSLLAMAGARGYRATWFRTVLVQQLPSASESMIRSDLEVRPVEDDRDFKAWHEVTVAGFGLTTRLQQAVARRWGEALQSLGDGRLLIARLAGVPVGVASLAACDGVALLGGMATTPEARKRGVQQGLISFRLKRAGEVGCAIAASTADPGSASERNLERRGFAIAGTKLGVTLQLNALPG